MGTGSYNIIYGHKFHNKEIERLNNDNNNNNSDTDSDTSYESNSPNDNIGILLFQNNYDNLKLIFSSYNNQTNNNNNNQKFHT